MLIFYLNDCMSPAPEGTRMVSHHGPSGLPVPMTAVSGLTNCNTEQPVVPVCATRGSADSMPFSCHRVSEHSNLTDRLDELLQVAFPRFWKWWLLLMGNTVVLNPLQLSNWRISFGNSKFSKFWSVLQFPCPTNYFASWIKFCCSVSGKKNVGVFTLQGGQASGCAGPINAFLSSIFLGLP